MAASVDDFLHRLSSGDPVPGGGSAAALQAAIAASLISMVCELTVGRKRFADVRLEVEGLREEAVALRDRASALMQQDVDAYAQVAAAMKMPRETDAEKAARRDRLQGALKAAAGPPLSVMEVSADILRVAERIVSIGNPTVVSDVGVAALAAHSACGGARLNVQINLVSVDNPAWVESVQERMRRLPDVDEMERVVLERVAQVMRGERL